MLPGGRGFRRGTFYIVDRFTRLSPPRDPRTPLRHSGTPYEHVRLFNFRPLRGGILKRCFNKNSSSSLLCWKNPTKSLFLNFLRQFSRVAIGLEQGTIFKVHFSFFIYSSFHLYDFLIILRWSNGVKTNDEKKFLYI